MSELFLGILRNRAGCLTEKLGNHHPDYYPMMLNGHDSSKSAFKPPRRLRWNITNGAEAQLDTAWWRKTVSSQAMHLHGSRVPKYKHIWWASNFDQLSTWACHFMRTQRFAVGRRFGVNCAPTPGAQASPLSRDTLVLEEAVQTLVGLSNRVRWWSSTSPGGRMGENMRAPVSRTC